MKIHGIYQRTAKGDNALEGNKITGRVSKLVMTVLDGELTVDDINAKLGSSDMGEKILEQLLKDGYIEPVHDADMAEDEEDKSSGKLSGLMGRFKKSSSQKKSRDVEEEEEAEDQDYEEDDDEEPKGFLAKLRYRQQQKAKDKEREAALSALRTGKKSGKNKVKVRRGGRQYRPPRSPLVNMVLFAVIALAVISLVLFFFPFGIFRSSYEETAKNTFGDKTSIGDISFSFTPYPNLTFRNIAVGQPPYLNIESALVIPDPLSLFRSRTAINKMKLDGVRVNINNANKLSKLFPGNAEAASINLIDIGTVTLTFSDQSYKYNGSIVLQNNGKLSAIRLRSEDLSMNLDVSQAPDDQGLAIDGNGLAWRLPNAPEVTFDRIAYQATIKDQRMNLNSVDGTILGGNFEGSGFLDWSAEDMIFNGRANLARASFAQLLAAIRKEQKGEGLISIQGQVNSTAKSFSDLANKYEMTGSMEVAQGSYTSFSLVEALREGRGEYRGGKTDFDFLSGNFKASPSSGINLSNLKVSSGVLSSSGSLQARGNRYYGGMSVKIQSARGTINATVNLSGTWDDPLVQVLNKP